MAVKRDYYDILGVDRNADDEGIRRAFRKLAFQHHPDRNRGDGAEEKFKEINEAHEVLSDPNKRANYDRLGFGGENIFGSGFEGFDFGGLGSIFETFFGGVATAARRGPRKGADLNYELTITFEEAALGCEKEVEIKHTEKCPRCHGSRTKEGTSPLRCPDCNGSGQVYQVRRSIFGNFKNITVCLKCRGDGSIITKPCSHCHGSGEEKVRRTISVKVPAGVDGGLGIRLNGEGDIGERGGPPGDVFLTLTVLSHKFLGRDGYDILYDVGLNFAQAALGTEVVVPTLYGDVKLKVPSGSQTGRVFRLKGKGVPHLGRRGCGDQLLKLRVVTPDKLDKGQRRLFEELGRSLDTDKGKRKGS